MTKVLFVCMGSRHIANNHAISSDHVIIAVITF